jgi:hypothetical protein
VEVADMLFLVAACFYAKPWLIAICGGEDKEIN